MRSLSASGASAASSELTIVIEPGVSCPTLPRPPESLSSRVDGRLVTISWSGVSQPDWLQRVEAGSAAGLADLAVIPLPGLQRVLVVEAPPGLYFVRVRTMNICGASAASNEIVVRVF